MATDCRWFQHVQRGTFHARVEATLKASPCGVDRLAARPLAGEGRLYPPVPVPPLVLLLIWRSQPSGSVTW